MVGIWKKPILPKVQEKSTCKTHHASSSFSFSFSLFFSVAAQLELRAAARSTSETIWRQHQSPKHISARMEAEWSWLCRWLIRIHPQLKECLTSTAVAKCCHQHHTKKKLRTYQELYGHQEPCMRDEGRAFSLPTTKEVDLLLAQVIETAILQACQAVCWSEKICLPFGHALQNGR